MKEMTVTFEIDEKQEKALEEPLEHWQQYEAQDGSRPFKDDTIAELFQHIMYVGSTHKIWESVKEEQFRQNLITVDELIDDKYLTAEDRKKQKAGA